MAIIAPTLLLLIFFLVQAVLLFYGRSVALQAARDGVTQLRLQQTADGCEASKGAVRQSVLEFASHVGSGALTSANAFPHCYFEPGGAATVTVEVTGEAISLLPFFPMHITQRATGPVEQFQSGG